MSDELRALTSVQLDMLKEICNIGAGNAATALAELLKRKISMNVPQVDILPFDHVADTVGGNERILTGIFLQVTGEAPVNILFFLPHRTACALVDMLLHRAEGTTTELDQLNQSVLEEVGNIVTGSFLAALSSFTGIRFYPSVPSLAVDMAGALLNICLLSFGDIGDQALVVHTHFSEEERNLEGYYFILPEPGSLSKIFATLGVERNG